MFGTFFRVVAALVLVGLVAAVGVGIYQAGVAQGIVESGNLAIPSGAPIVYPYPHYGYPWGFGFGFFGILITIFVIFLFFGLLRAIFRPRWGGPGAWGGPGGWRHHAGSGRWGGPGGYLEEWHREAHGEPPDQGSADKDSTGRA